MIAEVDSKSSVAKHRSAERLNSNMPIGYGPLRLLDPGYRVIRHCFFNGGWKSVIRIDVKIDLGAADHQACQYVRGLGEPDQLWCPNAASAILPGRKQCLERTQS